MSAFWQTILLQIVINSTKFSCDLNIGCKGDYSSFSQLGQEVNNAAFQVEASLFNPCNNNTAFGGDSLASNLPSKNIWVITLKSFYSVIVVVVWLLGHLCKVVMKIKIAFYQ
jgi:hypothetical protein